MSNTILIVLKNRELTDAIEDLFKETVTENINDIKIIKQENEQKAKEWILNGLVDLIITDYRMSTADKNSEIRIGMSLLENLKKEKIETPSVLITHVLTDELINATNRLYDCHPIFLRSYPDWETALLKKCLALLKLCTAPEKNGVVEIMLDMKKKLKSYIISGTKKGREFQRSDICDLEIHDKILEQLKRHSIKMYDYTEIIKMDKLTKKLEWEIELKELGEKVFEEIFLKPTKFRDEYHRLEGFMEGRENIDYRFKIKEDFFSIHLEAMYDENYRPTPYMMLTSPIYRKLNIRGLSNQPVVPGNKDQQKTNCLIIKSYFQGLSPEFDKKYDTLEKLAEEIKGIYRILDQNREEFHIGRILVIDDISQMPDLSEFDPCPIETGDWQQVEQGKFCDHVEKTLSEEQWHMVHYAGHTDVSDSSGKGCFLFPGTPYNYTIPVEKFSMWLRQAGTQFLFISGCRSSEYGMVSELADHEIPYIVGFRWLLYDNMAAKYAIQFYTHYVKEKQSLEKAFFMAQKDMHMQDEKHPMWAAPMLIKQC